MRSFLSFLTEAECSKYIDIPKDWKQTWQKRSFVSAGKGAKVFFVYLPLSKLSAAGRPSEAGEHVHDMIKTLKKKRLPPIVVSYDKNKYEVLDGNTRVLALKLMGATGKIPATLMTWEKNLPNWETF